MRSRSNLAGRAGRWSAGHWKAALFGWLAFAAGRDGRRERRRACADARLAVRERRGREGDRHARAGALQAAGARERADPEPVETARRARLSSRRSPASCRRSPCRRTSRTSRTRSCCRAAAATSRATATRCSSSSRSRATRTRRRTRSSRSWTPSPASRPRTRASRSARSASRARTTSSARSSRRTSRNAERLTIPITLLILLASFGALVAAGLPVLLAFSAVLASLGLFAALTHVYAGDYQSTSSVILLIGMAVGVDYSLFYLRREREERARRQRAARLALPRRVDLGTGGADLRRDGADRDVRHVHRRQPDLHRDGDRDDARRPLRDDRLAHRAAGGARRSSATASTAAACRTSGGASTPRASRASGASSSTASCAGRVLAVVARRRAAARWRRRRRSRCTRSSRASPTCRAARRSCRPTRPCSPPSRARRRRPRSSSARANVRDAGRRRLDPELEQAAVATGQMFQPILVTISPDDTVADIQIPLAGNGDDAASLAALHTLRTHGAAADRRHAPGRRVRGRRPDRRHARLQRADEAADGRS